MVKTKLFSRIKAAVISAAMISTAFITPTVANLSSVTAASVSVNKTLIADGLETSDSKKNTQVKFDATGVKTLTFNFETEYTGEVTVGVAGFTIDSDPWWQGATGLQSAVTPKDGKFSVTFSIPSTIDASTITAADVGIWYPNGNQEFTLTTMETDSSSTGGSTGGESTTIVTKNSQSGTCTFKDNGDGTADITSTLTAEISDEFEYLLTAGYDEERYGENGDLGEYVEGESLINAHKFSFTEFGIEDIENVTFQSFNYIIESDVDMKRFMYGGGINVTRASVADTEIVKGKNGYWYNDQGEEDVEEYGDLFLIDDYGTGYTVENVGTYAKVVWDVPASVQPCVTKDADSTVGFQFWYGQADAEEYTEIESVNLTGASCTYTRTMTVPYNTTISQKTNQTLTTGSDSTNQIKINLADLKLEERDQLSAVKFTVSGTGLEKMQFGVGISVDLENPLATDGWYQPNNITVLDDAGRSTYEIMWIFPDVVREDIDLLTELGNVMFGYWYGGDTEGNPVTSIKLDSVDFYTFQATEADLTVSPTELELTVGETAQIKTNIDGCTFETDSTYFTVDDSGNVEAVSAGAGKITVTTPEGQTATISVIIAKEATTSTAVTTTAVTTTTTVATTTAVTTVDPDDVIDWSKVLYGDVNLDGNVSAADVVTLNKYLISKTEYPLANATARENANAYYDDAVDMTDSSYIVEVVLETKDQSELGPQD